MGIDWIDQCAPTWNRSWDRGRIELSKPDLFTPETPRIQRTFRAICEQGQTDKLIEGKPYNLRFENGALLIYEGVVHVATSDSPPAEIVRLIQEKGMGHAVGTVTRIYPISGGADVAVS
jgi:hypothetical protein